MNRLKEMREDRDLLQEDLCKIIHISQPVYSKYENEQVDLSTDALKALADYYDCTIDYILYRTDYRKSLPKSVVDTTEDN